MPDPPARSVWYADIPAFGMLANNRVGCCVSTGAMHAIMQLDAYVHPGAGLIGTDAEAIHNYSAVGGYIEGDPATDQGLYVMGPGGLIEYWTRTGLMCGGKLNKLDAALQIDKTQPKQWKQAINTFAGLMIGIDLPQSIIATDDTPFVWRDWSGPSAGGHEIYAVGYDESDGLYDCVTWGTICRLSEEFLLATMTEAVCLRNNAALDARGIDAAGIDEPTLIAYMDKLRHEA